MQAYMKTDDLFFGVQSKDQEAIAKLAKARFPCLTLEEYGQVLQESWEIPGREGALVGFQVARVYKQYVTVNAWPMYVNCLKRCAWWDTLDAYATRLVSPVFLNNPQLRGEVWEWAGHSSMWMRRASILAHLKHKEDTHLPLFEDTLLKLASEQEFFIRKAIGWALRQYSYANPEWVAQFVDTHHATLSPLSRKEALKVIQRKISG